ncbi:MAG: 50S ribosomal protein L30 [Dehalococcoidales bacterium]|nr:50S ribosomal protein L30 [Dehalococcoidales bacterium]
MAKAKLRITWIKSAIGTPESQRQTLTTLGFRRLNQSVIHEDSGALRGMINKVRHLVKVEEASGKSE